MLALRQKIPAPETPFSCFHMAMGLSIHPFMADTAKAEPAVWFTVYNLSYQCCQRSFLSFQHRRFVFKIKLALFSRPKKNPINTVILCQLIFFVDDDY